MLIATVMEFGGAVLVGSRVADTIRSKILSVSAFEQQPAILMLGMMCALIGSSTWLTVATKLGLPVSTTLVLLLPSFLITFDNSVDTASLAAFSALASPLWARMASIGAGRASPKSLRRGSSLLPLQAASVS